MVQILHRYKHTYPDGSIVQIVIWDIPRTRDRPDGIRYRLAYVPALAASPAVLYDNHHPKGHHKHLQGVEYAYGFSDWNKLIEDFYKDKEAYENL